MNNFQAGTAILSLPADAELFCETVDTVDIAPVELKTVPKSFSGVSDLSVYSGQKFVVYLDGKRIEAHNLHVTHTRPMEVYGVRGMQGAIETECEPRTRVVEMLPRKGSLTVTAFEKDPVQEKLAQTKETGVTLYTDPDTVVVDGRVYRDLGVVKVLGLRDGKLTFRYSV